MPQRATNSPNEPHEPDDASLLSRAANGDGRAFHTLVDRHAQRMFRVAVSLVGNAADAEDVLQETWIGAYRNAGGFRGGAAVTTWLTRILVLQAAKWRRDRKRPSRQAEALSDQAAGKTGEPGEVGSASIDLQAALQQLTEEHRTVLVLREFDGLSYDEMAEVLAVPRGTVESRLHRAREQLREKLKAYQP